MDGLGTYLSGSGDLWQYLLLLSHLQPLQPHQISHQTIILPGEGKPHHGISNTCCNSGSEASLSPYTQATQSSS